MVEVSWRDSFYISLPPLISYDTFHFIIGWKEHFIDLNPPAYLSESGAMEGNSQFLASSSENIFLKLISSSHYPKTQIYPPLPPSLHLLRNN
jgi:hypothetical protein